MPYETEMELLDVSRETACELGKLIRLNIPAEYHLPLLTAVLDHVERQLQNNQHRIARTVEAGLVSGLGAEILKRNIDGNGDSGCGS